MKNLVSIQFDDDHPGWMVDKKSKLLLIHISFKHLTFITSVHAQSQYIAMECIAIRHMVKMTDNDNAGINLYLFSTSFTILIVFGKHYETIKSRNINIYISFQTYDWSHSWNWWACVKYTCDWLSNFYRNNHQYGLANRYDNVLWNRWSMKFTTFAALFMFTIDSIWERCICICSRSGYGIEKIQQQITYDLNIIRCQ